jgi:hypothetical protein
VRSAARIRARSAPSSGERGKSGRGTSASRSSGGDRAHEVDVGGGRPVEHGVGHRAEPYAAAVGLQREGRDQPGGQREGFGGGGRGVRDVGAERAGERQRPGHRPLLAVALLDGDVGHLEHTGAAHSRHRRGPISTTPSRSRAARRARRRRSRRGRAARAAGRVRWNGRWRAARRRPRRRAAAAGPRSSTRRAGAPRTARPAAVRVACRGGPARRPGRGGRRPPPRPVRGERHRPRRAHHPRLGRDGEHRREPDAEATDRARLVPFGRRPQRRERRHPRRGQRRAGVRHAQLGAQRHPAEPPDH